MRQFRFICIALVLSLGLFCSKPVPAQSDPAFETGLKPFGSYHGGNIDTVNLSNGSLNIVIPLMSYPQTGGKLKLDFAFRMNNFSYFYTVGYISCPDGSGNECATTDWETPGNFVGFTQEDVPMATGSWTDNGSEILGQAQITTPDQAIHQLGLTALTGGTWRSADATGYAVQGTYYADFAPNPVIDSQGLGYSEQALIPSGWYGAAVKDANGNQISMQTGGGYYGTEVTQWKDTLGRKIPVPASADSSGCNLPDISITSAMSWEFPGYDGQPQGYPILFCYGGPVLMQYYYWYVPPYDGTGWQAQQSYYVPMLQYIVLPTNTYWKFAYTSDGNGNLTQITFPTGGALCYTWNNFVGGNPDSNYQMESQVASRSLDPSGTCSQSSPTWTYQRVGPSGGNVTVTDPAGNNTVHHFTIPYGLQTYYETETDYPAGKTVYNSFTAAGSCGVSDGAILTQTETLWSNGQQSKIQYGYDSGFSAGQPWETDNPPPYNPVLGGGSCLYGLQTSKQEYDFGASSSTRTTTTTYQYQNNSNYLTPNLLDLPASVQVTGVGPGSYTTYGYDESGSPQCVCGNQTSIHDWLNTTGGYLTTSKVYNSNGLATSVTDPKGNLTTYSYSGSCYAGSGPISVTNALNQTTWFCYDFNTGLMTGTEDPNNQTTSYVFDNMLRTTEINYPDTGQTSFNYPSATEVDITDLTDHQGGARNSLLRVDGLGRETVRGVSVGGVYDETDTCYDGIGRVSFKSYPYYGSGVGSCTEPGDTFGYDGLDRTTSATHSDSSVISTSYSGSYANISDEQSKTRQTYTDALGRMTQVVENPGGLGYTTTYSYNALDDLVGVTQAGSRQRSFVYDSLSQLSSAYNPESGTTSYTYDADGNVTTKTDARGTVTCFGQWANGACNSGSGTTCNASIGYDALNRVCTKTYSDGSMGAIYGYDVGSQFGVSSSNPIGRLVYEDLWYPASGSNQYATWTVFGYDSMGRVTSEGKCFPSPIVQCNYETNASEMYDLVGDPTSLTYPDGRVVKTKYDPAARPTQVTFDNYQGTSVGYNYLSAASYAADGSPLNVTLGNGVTESTTYNSRMQPCNQQIATGLSTWVNRTYSFYSTPSCSGSGGNNGNVFQIADNLQNGRTQNFSYDPLNRLASAATQTTSGPDCWGNTYGYDPWGNLLQQNVTQCSAPYMNLSVNTSNQITNSGFGYDAAGNMTANNGISYQYDAESRLTNYASGGAVYTYDAEGNRVQKQSGGTTTDYVYFGGQPIAEYNPAISSWTDYVYAGDRKLVRANDSEYALEIQGTNCSNCGWLVSTFSFPNVAGYPGYVIQSGDHLFLKQYQAAGSHGGMILCFGDGTCSNNVDDSDGQPLLDDGEQEITHYRSVDLSAFAGETLGSVFLDCYGDTSPGNWAIVYEDIVLVAADGTVRPIFVTGQTSASLGVQPASGATNVLYQVQFYSGRAIYPQNTTSYYHSDHLGSARLLTNWYGYPVWSGTFLPFGQEWNPEFTVNTHKFTGKERDSESGLDNFGARYNSSQLGRFMSPDWAAKPTAVPYANFGNPQSLNLYTYVENNPTTTGDPDGHQSLTTDVSVAMDAWLWNHMTERQRQFTTGAAALISLPFGGEGLLAEAGEAAEAGSALKSTIVAVKAIGLTSAGVMGSMQVTGAAMNFSTAPAEPVMNFISLPADGLTSLSVLKNPNSVISDPIGTIQAGQNVVNTGGNLLDTLINIALSHILPTTAPPTLPAQLLPPSPTGPTVTTCSASAETQNNAPQKTCTVYDPAGGGA